MTIDFNKVTHVFAANHRANCEVAEFQDIYSALRRRIVQYVDVPSDGELGDKNRIRSYAIAYRQILLHRNISLLEGSLQAAIDENAYVMILSVRASFETAAALGYLHYRLSSLAAGNLRATKIDEDIMKQILGTKDTTLSKSMPPKQILSMLEYADVSVSRKILGGQTKEHTILRESYDFLCEYAHPNFHSNKLSFDLDKSRNRFVFRYKERMHPEVFSTICYLLLSLPLHVELHDGIDEVLPH